MEARTLDPSSKARGCGFDLLRSIDTRRFGAALHQRDWIWSAEVDDVCRHHGSLALIAATLSLPFEEVAPRIAPALLARAVALRGGAPTDARLAAEILDGCIMRLLPAPPDTGSTLTVHSERRETHPYAAESKLKRSALHAFLIGSLTTIARPDAVLDISVDPKRRQWWPGSQTIDLNPANRRQTKKYRPMLPVLPLLETWLRSISTEGGWLVAHNSKPVGSIGKAWTSMLVALKLPVDREWMPYLLRHSIATLVRDKRPDPWELSGYMGHRLPGQTETYAVGSLYPTVTSALQDLLDEIETRHPGVLQRSADPAAMPG